MLKNSIFHGIENKVGEKILFPHCRHSVWFACLLFDDLDGTFGTLHLACSTDYAVLNVYWNRLFVLQFVNTYRTNVDACSASSAFIHIDMDFNH